MNFKFNKAVFYFRDVVNSTPFDSNHNMGLYSALYSWLGDIMETLDYYVWAVDCYLKCCKYYFDHPNFSHPFVTVAFIYLKIAEIFYSTSKEKRENTELAKYYYHNAFNYLDESNLKQNKTFIELSPFTIYYNQAAIAIRVGCILYLERNFTKSIDFLTRAEKLLLKIRFE